MTNTDPIGDRCPLPTGFALKCHLADAVARDVDETGCVAASRRFERPTVSRAFVQSVLCSFPKSIMLKEHMLDENLHTGDEPFRSGGAAEQPQSLNTVRKHREKGEAPNRVPVPHAEILYVGALFPTADAFLNAPPSHVCGYNTRGLLGGCDVVVGEQDHVVFAQTGNDNHEEASFETGKSHGCISETERPLLETVGAFADVRDVDFMGFVNGLGQAAHEDGVVVSENHVPRLELADDPFDAESIQDEVEVIGIHPAVEEPRRLFAGVCKHIENRTSNVVIPVAVIRMTSGKDLVPQGQVSVLEISCLDLNGRESGADAFTRVACIADDC